MLLRARLAEAQMTAADEADWKPGSFTKNFSWGRESGLNELHDSIREGFAGELHDVPRTIFRQRVAANNRPDYIPINFFLFNRQAHGIDTLVVDELVFQALSGPIGDRFDKLALFSFNFSFAGKFKRASPEQRRPALWAHHYVRDRIAGHFEWNVLGVSADDIERFVVGSPKYKAKGARKLATNLNHLYRIGRDLYTCLTRSNARGIAGLCLARHAPLVESACHRKPRCVQGVGIHYGPGGLFKKSKKKNLIQKLAV